MKKNIIRTYLGAICVMALFVSIIIPARAQIEFPDPPPIVPVWRNVAAFSGAFPDPNWTFYGSQYPAMWYPQVTSAYTNFPWMTNIGMCMNFVPYASWAGASTLVTNQFDTNGYPYANMIMLFVCGGNDWDILVSTTNDVPIYQSSIGDDPTISGLGLYTAYMSTGTNWSRLSLLVPANTNPIVKVTVRLPWQDHTWSGASPPGYIANNGGILGGVTWDAIIPPPPPGPLTAPDIGKLGVSRWTNGVSVVYWSISNTPATLKHASDAAGPYSSFTYEPLTNIFGTNVVGTFVSSTNQAGFYRLEN